MTDFPISAAVPRIQYVADGVQTVFTVPFPVPTLDDLRVRFGDGASPTSFTASSLGGATATITFAVAPPVDTRITIRRVMAHARLTDFDEGGELRASALNAELDALVMQVQQVAETASRALAYAPDAPPAPVPHLPLPAPGYLRWNDDADALVLDPVPQALLAQAVAAMTAAESAATTADAAAVATGNAADVAMGAAATAGSAAVTADSAADLAQSAAATAVAAAAALPAERRRGDLALLRHVVRADHGAALALPAMGIDFTLRLGLDDLVFTALSDSRACWDAQGRLRPVAAHVPRFDHDPLTGAPRGLLLEPARTNMLLHSTDPAQAPWTTSGMTRGTGAQAPDGSGTFTRLTATGASGGHQLYQAVTVESGKTYTASAIVRSTGSQRWLRFVINATAAVASAWFDLLNGTWGTVTAGTTVHPPIQIATGCWRIAVTATATAGGTGYWNMVAASGDGVPTGWAASGETFDLWSPQLEEGRFPTSCIATSGAQVTRAAELAGLADADDALAPRAGTVLLDARPLALPQGVARLFRLGSTTDGCSLYLPDGDDTLVFEVRAADTTIAGIDAPAALTANATGGMAAAWAPDAMALSADGVSPATDASGTPALSPASFDLGHAGGGQVFAGWIERVVLFPRRLPDAALATLTDH